MSAPAPDTASGPTPAERRAARRARQTTFNLVIALVASFGLVLLLVIVVVRPDVERPDVDYRAVGADAQHAVEERLVVPDLPEEWRANRAVLVTDAPDGVVRWEIGLLTPGGDYIGFVQGIDANPSWLTERVAGARGAGTARIGGIEWTRHDRRHVDDPGNLAFALTTVDGASTIVLGGTASEEEFAELAAAVAEGRG